MDTLTREEQLREAYQLWMAGRPWSEVAEAMAELPAHPLFSGDEEASQPASRHRVS